MAHYAYDICSLIRGLNVVNRGHARQCRAADACALYLHGQHRATCASIPCRERPRIMKFHVRGTKLTRTPSGRMRGGGSRSADLPDTRLGAHWRDAKFAKRMRSPSAGPLIKSKQSLSSVATSSSNQDSDFTRDSSPHASLASLPPATPDGSPSSSPTDLLSSTSSSSTIVQGNSNTS